MDGPFFITNHLGKTKIMAYNQTFMREGRQYLEMNSNPPIDYIVFTPFFTLFHAGRLVYDCIDSLIAISLLRLVTLISVNFLRWCVKMKGLNDSVQFLVFF